MKVPSGACSLLLLLLPLHSFLSAPFLSTIFFSFCLAFSQLYIVLIRIPDELQSVLVFPLLFFPLILRLVCFSSTFDSAYSWSPASFLSQTYMFVFFLGYFSNSFLLPRPFSYTLPFPSPAPLTSLDTPFPLTLLPGPAPSWNTHVDSRISGGHSIHHVTLMIKAD